LFVALHVPDKANTLNGSYRFAQISRTLRALQNSTKTSLRIEEEGLLSLQFLVPVPKPRGGMSDSFIEFRVRFFLISKVEAD
jgi:cell cycle checkpoint protein